MKSQKINLNPNQLMPIEDPSIEDLLFSRKSVEPRNSADFIQCRISSKNGDHYISELHSHLTIKKSFSCLIEPAVGDLVLCTCCDNVAYIINILEKHDISQASINYDGKIKLKSKMLHIEASEYIKMESHLNTIKTKKYDIDASSIRVNSKQYVRVTEGFDVVKADNIFVEAVYSINSKAYRAIEKLSSIKKIIAEKILMG